MTEAEYQAKLIKRIKAIFPGCLVLKNDPNYLQGVPDLSIFYNNKWAVLEVKRSENESHRPNQDYYINKLNDMSFASFIFPENEEEVLHELQSTLRA